MNDGWASPANVTARLLRVLIPLEAVRDPGPGRSQLPNPLAPRSDRLLYHSNDDVPQRPERAAGGDVELVGYSLVTRGSIES